MICYNSAFEQGNFDLYYINIFSMYYYYNTLGVLYFVRDLQTADNG